MRNQKRRLLPFACVSRVYRGPRLEGLAAFVLNIVLKSRLHPGAGQFQPPSKFDFGLVSHQGLSTRAHEVIGLPIQEAAHIGRDEEEHARCGHFGPQLTLADSPHGDDIVPRQGVHRPFPADHDDTFATLTLLQMERAVTLEPGVAVVLASDAEDHVDRGARRGVLELAGDRNDIAGMTHRRQGGADQFTGVVLQHLSAGRGQVEEEPLQR